MNKSKRFAMQFTFVACITITIFLCVGCIHSKTSEQTNVKESEQDDIQTTIESLPPETSVQNIPTEEALCRKNTTEDPLFIFNEGNW